MVSVVEASMRPLLSSFVLLLGGGALFRAPDVVQQRNQESWWLPCNVGPQGLERASIRADSGAGHLMLHAPMALVET